MMLDDRHNPGTIHNRKLWRDSRILSTVVVALLGLAGYMGTYTLGLERERASIIARIGFIENANVASNPILNRFLFFEGQYNDVNRRLIRVEDKIDWIIERWRTSQPDTDIKHGG